MNWERSKNKEMNFQQEVKVFMLLNKITQTALATELGISRSYLDRVLNERIGLSTFMKSKLEQYLEQKK